jgi:hypothetical protein
MHAVAFGMRDDVSPALLTGILLLLTVASITSRKAGPRLA